MIKHSTDKNNNLHNDEDFVEIILSLFKKEVADISSDALRALLQEIEKIYEKLEITNKLKNNLLPAKSALHYFVKKEIKYFCKHLETFIESNGYLKDRRYQTNTHLFTLIQGWIRAKSQRISIIPKAIEGGGILVKLMLEQSTTSGAEVNPANNETTLLRKTYSNINDNLEAVNQFLKEDEYKFLNKLYGFDLNNLMSYIWLYNSTNYDIKSKFNFNSSKTTILKLFVKFYAETVDIVNKPEDKELADLLNDLDEFRNISQSEMEQYIKNASNSTFPEAYLLGEKKLRSQIGEVLKNIYGNTSKIVKTYIETVDTTVFVGRLLSKSFNIPLSILWNTLSQEEKYKKLCQEPGFRYFYKNIDMGRSAIPSPAFTLLALPITKNFTKETATHIGFDTVDYAIELSEYIQWNNNFNKNNKCDENQCEPRINGENVYDDLKCTPQRKEQLIKELEEKEN